MISCKSFGSSSAVVYTDDSGESEMLQMLDEGIEIHVLDSSLAQGSLAGCRRKFSVSAREAVLQEIIDEITEGRLYLGDWRKGEIEIVGIKRIITNRFWTEVEYNVLFPPRKGTVPATGTYRNTRWNSGISAGAGALLLTANGEIVLLHSFRHAKRAWTFELPRGIRKPGESPEQCALREGTEECGAKLTSETVVINLGIHDPDTGIVAQEVPIIAFTNVEVDEALVSRDVSESKLTPVIVTVAEFAQMVRDGRITDGWICSAFGRALVHGLIKL